MALRSLRMLHFGLSHFNTVQCKRQFRLTYCLLKKSFTRSSEKFTKVRREREGLDQIEHLRDESDVDSQEDEYHKLIDRTFRVPDNGHSVFVIQPYVKWGPNKKRTTTPELQLAESCALINTLHNWNVADKIIISLLSMDKTTLFGKGNLEKLLEKVVENKNISAVFISMNILKGVQREFLENLFKVPVYDRYSVVIQIFREHATSREAKLQLRLAEFPYLRGRVRHLHSQHHFTGSSGETYTEFQRNILKEKERKVKLEIESLRSQRDLLRKRRRKSSLPIVAVVGYTNSGKTSLIKALTNEETIVPKDVLFATLDVTVHAGSLPSGFKVLYIDTIGFISDIPTNLIESFVATLEDALLADVIIHVRDVSHPDVKAQMEHVHETLQGFNLNKKLLDNMIEVGNKVDLIRNKGESNWENVILTSAVKSRGIEELKTAIEASILKATGRQRMGIRVKTGEDEYQWLLREAAICDITADPNDLQYSVMHVIITPDVLARFKHIFITSKR